MASSGMCQPLDEEVGHDLELLTSESVMSEMKPVTTSELLLPLIDYCELNASLADSSSCGKHDDPTVTSVAEDVVEENNDDGLLRTMSVTSTVTMDALQQDQNENPSRPVNTKQTVSSKRRRRSVLTLQQKLDVIRRIKEGEKVTRLAAEYGVGKATVSQLRSQESRIAAFVAKMSKGCGGTVGGIVTRRTMRMPQEERVERALRSWLKVECAKGIVVNGPVLREMAKTYHQRLYGEANNGSSFKASTGWLHRFKRRNGIKVMPPSKVETHAEVQSHLNLMRGFVRDNNIDAERIYTVDKMRLHWRALPLRSSSSKDSIEVLFCMNATGSHRLRLALIDDGRVHDPLFDEALNVSAIPFRRYRTWKVGATWDSDTFAEWFRDEFATAVSTSTCGGTTTTSAALLMVGSACSSNGHLATLHTDDGAIRCVALSSATSFVTQAVNLSLFKQLGLDYRKSLVTRIVAIHRLHRCVGSQLGRLVSVNDAGYMLNEAWLAIRVESVRHLWRDTLQCIGIVDADVGVNTASDSNSVVNYATEICVALKEEFAEDVSEECGISWLLMDAGDTSHRAVQVEFIESDDGDHEGEVGMCASEKYGLGGSVPSITEAHMCFIKGLAWLERQPNCDAADLRVLWKLQSMAAATACITSNK